MSDLRVAIVGAGLVGSLEACLLARRGFQVTLFEGRPDGRSEPNYYGRSINLAISLRGISALKRLNLDHIVEERAVPMKARMIHSRNGRLGEIPYDPDGRCINSIERASLNNYLLNKAEQEFKVKVLFNHKLVEMNAEKGELLFIVSNLNKENDSNEKSTEVPILRYKFDLILGCDGSRSAVRGLLARQTQLEVSQTYIEHGYIELRIDPNEDGSFKMPPNYLHIWPRGQYMMIALPNRDASFTCTLFMPFSILNQLKDPDEALRFFRKNFLDSIELIGQERIQSTLSNIRASSLISIKCEPYFYKHRVALLGDAAHAMVPFYGQGMNCGFEDCLVFDELLDQQFGEVSSKAPNLDQVSLERVLQEYSDRRCKNGHSMCDLAMYNYIEMRDLVNTWSYIMRKHLDNFLYRIVPTKWIPLYTMVTFSRIPVNECIRRREEQDKVLNRCMGIGALVLSLSLVVTSWRLGKISY